MTVPPVEGAPSILGGDPNDPAGTPVRTIEVQVLWTEGQTERSVVRRTYAFDAVSVADQLAAVAPGGLEGGLGAAGGGGDAADLAELNRVVEQLRSQAEAQ